jgi:hypothetical protein
MEVLSLFTGEAVAAVEESREEGMPSPVAVLASIIAPQGASPSAQTTAVQVAAAAVVSPQMFATLSAAGQSTLSLVGLSQRQSVENTLPTGAVVQRLHPCTESMARTIYRQTQCFVCLSIDSIIRLNEGRIL